MLQETKTALFWSDMILAKRVFILLSGKAGVGKTTFAEFLKKKLEDESFEVIKASFAGELKKIARECFYWNGEKDKKGRALLQEIGNTGRNYDEDIWVKYLLYNVEDRSLFVDFVIVDDWRYPNEYEYLKNTKDNNVVTVRILSNERGGLEGELNNHSSETSLKDNDLIYDVRIHNDKSLEDLEKEAKLFVENLLKGEINV